MGVKPKQIELLENFIRQEHRLGVPLETIISNLQEASHWWIEANFGSNIAIRDVEKINDLAIVKHVNEILST